MTSSESEQQAPSRKRSRTNNDAKSAAAAGSKKPRGRPRVETKDVDAADRRRTQIRLAQRAYRHRKEKTIETLEVQRNQLQSIIGQLSKAFNSVNDSTLKSGLLQLNPNLAREFKVVSDTFTTLVKTANEDKFDDDDDENCEPRESTGDGSTAADSRPNIPSPPVVEPQNVGWGYSAMNPTGKVESPQNQTQTYPDNDYAHLGHTYAQAGADTSLVRHRQYTVGDVLDQSRSSQNVSPQAPNILPFGFLDLDASQPFTPPNPHIYSIHIPTPNITPPTTRLPTPPVPLPNLLSAKTIRPVTTYSFDESTFARRLTRAAIETGFRLLSNAEVRPEALKYIFKLSLPWFSLDQLIDRFKIMLSRGINDGLDWWETPFIHLGGAGTHYPRRDSFGNVIPIRNGWTVRQIGPVEKRMVRLLSMQTNQIEDIEGVDLSGLEGEWFDAHDVEGYFEEKYSCRVDPRSSFAQCWIDEDDEDITDTPFCPVRDDGPNTRRSSDEESTTPSLTNTSTSGSSSSSSASVTPPVNAFKTADTLFSSTQSYSQNQPPMFHTDVPRLTNYEISFDQTLGLDLAPGFDYGFAGNNGWSGNASLGLDMMGENVDALPIVRQRKKKSVWVDVNRLVDELIKHTVCLGRAPGFRRKDVDIAFRKSLMPAY